jgi:hypothetical protein
LTCASNAAVRGLRALPARKEADGDMSRWRVEPGRLMRPVLPSVLAASPAMPTLPVPPLPLLPLTVIDDAILALRGRNFIAAISGGRIRPANSGCSLCTYALIGSGCLGVASSCMRGESSA